MDSLQNSRGNFKSTNQNNFNGNYIQQKNIQRKETAKGTMKDKTEENENKPLKKQSFNWCNYLGHLICCERTNKKIKFYKDFRAKLISEENIIQNYIDIYKNNEYIKNKVFNKV